jgi:hypothetical protein
LEQFLFYEKWSAVKAPLGERAVIGKVMDIIVVFSEPGAVKAWQARFMNKAPGSTTSAPVKSGFYYTTWAFL